MVVYTSPKMGVRNMQELLEKPDKHLVLASMGPTSDDIFVLLAFDLLDVDVSSIFGSRGRGPARKIYERGDANIDFQTTAAYMTFVKPQELKGQAIPLFSLGAFDDDMEYVRDPLFPQLPNLAEVYEHVHGRPPSGEAWEAWFSLYKAGLGSLKLVVAPRNTPNEIMRSYEEAITRLQQDPEFNAAVVGVVGERSIIGGRDADLLFQRRTSLPEATALWLKSWIYDRYKVRL